MILAVSFRFNSLFIVFGFVSLFLRKSLGNKEITPKSTLCWPVLHPENLKGAKLRYFLSPTTD